MKSKDEKILMWEAATLYYEKKYTQQEIAELMNLSRQTVSKLLGDAVKENIVEIKIHDPKKNCSDLEGLLQKRFGLTCAVVCAVSSENDALRQLMSVKAAAGYIVPLLKQGNLKIAVSWGRTIKALIDQMPTVRTTGNLVFPLFGATDVEDPCFSCNEIARALADKLYASVQYAWFPYLTEHEQDYFLLKNTGYYKKIRSLWEQIDIALVGIGNTDVVNLFSRMIRLPLDDAQISGDIATHFFEKDGSFRELYQTTLCADVEDIRKAKQTIAVACGSEKIDAIQGALNTKLLDVLITDEHTARQILGV